jgi:enoyl-CoA hydratase/carnithine racemase
MIHLERTGPVFVLQIDAGENRFSPDMVKAFDEALDRVDATEGPKALVTVGTGKFYSNGLDLEYMMGEGRDRASEYLASVLSILGRILIFPAPTVAAVSGHAFGAGAQLAVAHDIRLMRADRGFFCMPEIDMKAFLHPGMTALLKARLPRQTCHEVIVTGTRYGGELAAQRGIVDEALSDDALLPAAIERAGALAAKADPVMAQLKAGLYAHVMDALAEPLVLTP